MPPTSDLMTEATVWQHRCAQTGCDHAATHLVIEADAMAMLFKSGCGLVCAKHAKEYARIGGINVGRIRDVLNRGER
jgi:hypothetical protein